MPAVCSPCGGILPSHGVCFSCNNCFDVTNPSFVAHTLRVVPFDGRSEVYKSCLLGREDELEQQLCDAEREADGIGAVDEDVLGGHDAVDGPQQGVGAPG